MPKPITRIPTNLIMGFLGVGKTTAIIDLIRQKPEDQNWAVLVNEFGKVGIDGAILAATGVSVKEIAGGCLCCAAGVPFRVGLNRLIQDVRPDRLLIEPTGLGHPKKVLDMLLDESYLDVLELKASLCLVDPEKLKDSRYTSHKTFIDQMEMSDVLIANKTDLADQAALDLFYQQAEKYQPPKGLFAQTLHAQLNIQWLDIAGNSERSAIYPDAHAITRLAPLQTDKGVNQADGFQSFGRIFDAGICFDFAQLEKNLQLLKVERIKAVFLTNLGWIVVNGVAGTIDISYIRSSTGSRFEIIARQGELKHFSSIFDHCIADKCN